MKTFIILVISTISLGAFGQMPIYSYDAGPSLDTEMGKELIDITAAIPNMPEVSRKIIGRKQKFRPAFGPIPWRMRLEENAVKILFMGQDGTHIAEAAGRPATAGFGGRAQDLANYFGVNEGAAFMNAYAFTIKGQYGVYNTPYIFEKDGEYSVRTANIVDNKLWAISNNLNSPIVKWRNSLIDWIIRNNKKSLKLIVLFGGAARDAVATYAKSKGMKVFGRYEKQMRNIQVAETKPEYAGGNNTFPSLVAQDGGDLYADILGKKVDYKNLKAQKEVIKSLKENLPEYLEKMVFTKGGPYKNGLLNSAQIGGYDLETMRIGRKKTRSLKGLTLDDGSEIENDIIVISLPHPSYLSRLVMDADSYAAGKAAASKAVMKNVRVLDKFAKKGWEIQPDLNKTNFYAQGKDYEYGRSDIGPEFYDFGTPKNRMVSKSTARRMSGAPNVVIIGTRDNGQFSKSAVKRMTEAKPSFGINPDNLYIARPSALEDRYTFDPGPGEKFAKLMKLNLDLDAIFEAKEDMSFKEDGIAAFNIKSHPSVGDFGHYRGTFNNPKVVILADPQGYDDIVTARALTGSRGQYLQSLMTRMGVNDDYLVIKTVPFAMDGATESEWDIILEQTKNYRSKLLAEVLKMKPELVLADGEYAAKALSELVGKKNFFEIKRADQAFDFGLKEVAAKIDKLGAFTSVGEFNPSMENIPRSHLSFYARVWEGTSGDRVITSRGIKYKGIAFAEVVPEWAYKQEKQLQTKSAEDVSDLIYMLDENKLPLPYESIPEYLERRDIKPGISFNAFLELWNSKLAA